MTKIYLTRHGQTEWNVEKRMQGQGDSPLTALGISQATALGERLKYVPIDVVYSSSAGRAMRTAEIIVGQRNIPILPQHRLQEIHIGRWSGMLMSDVERLFPTEAHNFWHCPAEYVPQEGGETYKQLVDRSGAMMEKIASENNGRTPLVVCHGIVLKALFCYFRNQPLADIAAQNPHPKPTCLCEVVKENGVWYINRWNDVSHYEKVEEQATKKMK